MKKFIAALAMLLVPGVLWIMALDYFGDGCMVDGRALKEVRPGLQVWVSGRRCQQMIIKTERGRQLDTGGRIVFD